MAEPVTPGASRVIEILADGSAPITRAAALAVLRRGVQGDYETVAASQTAQALGATGAAGDYIEGVLVIPAVVACGLVTLLDGATSIPIFVGGGTTALVDPKPFWVKLGMISVSGAWKITTGANVSVIGVGKFT